MSNQQWEPHFLFTSTTAHSECILKLFEQEALRAIKSNKDVLWLNSKSAEGYHIPIMGYLENTPMNLLIIANDYEEFIERGMTALVCQGRGFGIRCLIGCEDFMRFLRRAEDLDSPERIILRNTRIKICLPGEFPGV